MNKKPLVIAVTVAAAFSIFAAVALTGAKMNAQREAMATHKAVKTAPEYPDVEVVAVTAAEYQASVVGYGEVTSHYTLTLTSEVSGRVVKLAEQFESGQQFAAGELLVSLNDTTYQQAVASAQAAVASANQAWLEAEREAEQARLEWQRSGLDGEPDSALVLHEPQLKVAKAELENARQQLAKANKDLADTQIRAPFDAVVVSRDVQPGSYLQAGSSVASLNSTDRVEVSVPLSAAQWANLPAITTMTKQQWPVELVSSENQQSWSGYVLRAEQHLDNSSRQRSLVVALDKPLQHAVPLYAGEFVEVHVQGKPLNNVWQLPASAISQSGEIWLADEKGVLSSYAAEQQFAKGGSIYVSPVNGDIEARVVVRPLNSYVEGMYTNPKPGGDA